MAQPVRRYLGASRAARTGSPSRNIRAALDTSMGARVLVFREDLEGILATGAPEPDGESVTLTMDMVELLAEAAWSSAPTTRVAVYGTWDDLPEEDPRRLATLDGARRTLHYLFTGEALPEDD